MVPNAEYPNRYYRAARFSAGVLVLSCLAVAGTYDASSLVVMFVPIATGTFGLVGALGLWLSGVGVERSLRLFREGKSLGRWEVDGDQWAAHAAAKRAKFAGGRLWALVAGVVMVGLVLFLAPSDPAVLVIMTGMTVMAVGGALVAIHLTHGRIYAASVSRALIEVGPTVALVNGHVVSFAGFGQQVTGIELDLESFALVVRGRADSGDSIAPFSHELPFPPEAKEAATKAALALGLLHGLSTAVED